VGNGRILIREKFWVGVVGGHRGGEGLGVCGGRKVGDFWGRRVWVGYKVWVVWIF
jgi:hypothetical protein